jgi:hypothetical protein
MASSTLVEVAVPLPDADVEPLLEPSALYLPLPLVFMLFSEYLLFLREMEAYPFPNAYIERQDVSV